MPFPTFVTTVKALKEMIYNDCVSVFKLHQDYKTCRLKMKECWAILKFIKPEG